MTTMKRKISDQELGRMIKIILFESPSFIDQIKIKEEWKKLKRRIDKWEQFQKKKKII